MMDEIAKSFVEDKRADKVNFSKNKLKYSDSNSSPKLKLKNI